MENEQADVYKMLEEQGRQRTYVEPYRDFGWIIGNYGDFYIVWLDHFAERPVFVRGCDLILDSPNLKLH